MNKSRLLWVLIVADVLLSFASVGVEGFFGWTLPPVLAAYEHDRFASFSIAGVGDVMRLLLLGTTVLCAFAAWIGLAGFWQHGRRLYVVSLSMAMLLTLAHGPYVITSMGAMLRAMNGLVGGAILGLVYMTDLARRFEPESAGAALSAGANAPHRA